jgi:hypothetical protein
LKDLGQICLDLQNKHLETHSWRETAKDYGIFPSMARLLSLGYKPGKKIRKLLDLPPLASVTSMDGDIPDGAQAHGAQLCPCGQYFISNHPRRGHCFTCSPCRKRKL